MILRTLLALLPVIPALQLPAQQLRLLAQNDQVSLRGLSVVSDRVIWVSGSHGMVGKSVDSGATWQWTTVPQFENRDFRDIEAFDDREAVIMAIAEPAVILKTKDGGHSWQKVFEDSSKGMFLDAMDFSDRRHGMLVGDPVNGKFFIRSTEDGGDSWQLLSPPRLPPVMEKAVLLPAEQISCWAAIGIM